MTALQIDVLGPLRVTRSGLAIQLGPQQRVLVCALVSELGQAIPGTRLAELMWGEPAPERALVTLRSHISHLRQRLESASPGDNRASDPPVIHTQTTAGGSGYALHIAPGQVDLHRFAQLGAAARRVLSAGDFAAAEHQFNAALALWRGPAFADVADRPFAQPQIARLDGLRRAAVQGRAEAILGLGRPDEVAGELAGRLTVDPDDAELRRLLAIALYQSGQVAQAAAVCREGITQAHQLGIPPAELEDLQRRILRAEIAVPPRQTPPDPAPATPDDTRRQDRVPPPNMLPADTAHFTDRETELAAIRTAVTQAYGSTVVVTIDGMPGAGKSSLAVRAAHQLSAHYPDGQLFLDLGGHTPDGAPMSPAKALGALLNLVGMGPGELASGQVNRVAQWRSELADRRMLLLLDNAASAAQVRPLLPSGPGCLTLITSRRRLSGLDSAVSVSLGVLDPEPAATLLCRVSGRDRSSDDPASVGLVVRSCGFLPLAIAIAGARLRHRPSWSAGYLAERLESDPLPELVAEDRSVSAAFAMSYRGLDEARRRVFHLLDLLPGPDFAPATVAAAAGLSLTDAVRILEDLLDMHLVQQPAPGRYRLHDLIRVYACELRQATVPEQERQAEVSALLDYYVEVAAAAADVLDPHRRRTPLPGPRPVYDLPIPATAQAAMDWLEAERSSIVEAVKLANKSGLGGHAWRLARAMARFFNRRSYLDDWLSCGQEAVRGAAAAGEPVGEGISLTFLATACLHDGRYAMSKRLLLRSMRIHRSAGDEWGEAAATEVLGNVEGLLGHSAEGLRQQARAVELYRLAGDVAGQAHALNGLGAIHRGDGRLKEALQHYHRAHALFRQTSDRVGEGYAILNLGDALEQLGRCEEALAVVLEALPLLQNSGHLRAQANALSIIGGVYRRAGRFRDAIASHQEALAAMRRIGYRLGEIEALNDLGETYLDSGSPALVAGYCQPALQLAEDAEMPQARVRAQALLERASGWLRAGSNRRPLDFQSSARTN